MLTGKLADMFATRAYESLKNLLANLAVVFQNLQAQQNLHWPWPVGRGLS